MKKLVGIAVLIACTQLLFAQANSKVYRINTGMFGSNAGHWYGIKDKGNVINPKKNQPKYKATDIAEVGDNILLYQKNNGGWPKNYDVMAILTPDQKDSLQADKSHLNTTFDNGTTYTHVACLAGIYQATGNRKYAEGAVNGLNFIIKAQYANGGWPQYYPLENNYSRRITYNDDAYLGIMQLLKDIKDSKPEYSFIDETLRKKLNKAFDNGLECILNTQINDKGLLTAWCQQHDEVTLQPAWARKFEPPCICNAESSGIVMLLMDIDRPSVRVVQSVKAAVKWFELSAIKGIRVQTVQAPADTSAYTISHIDRVVVQDASAPQIWTRYYELGTHRPMFCNRDSKVVYSLAEVARERRSGYGWYTYNPQKVIDRYATWAKKWNAGAW